MLNKIDFSKLERLTPREDSWAKVCARLDVEALNAPTKKNIIAIKTWYSAIPLAASFVLVSLTAILPSFTSDIEQENSASTEYVSINNSAPSEVLSWYSSLGNSTSDEFETLEETVGFNYLTKE
ncbi:hypothetical protein SAMN05720470_105192 [Fibrobacter sp. UWOV1]|jgi:hypothetical protein|uniref:hypothetical protein n=1 Tax=Fibrobacter sp. UWOV1 TaxID=1896215 RepID=UPI0009242F77|nr:hypothetical protein [Fibrobacter sp. UWOV1]SHL19025.1 hypothetical protein SAMN05720470_105192 [Fibrobacter sp. UWOV1]